MKNAIFVFALIASTAASCATQATKEYVDRQDATNRVQMQAYTDAQIAEVERKIVDIDVVGPLVEELVKTNVPGWAREANKPEYTASEVHALPDSTFIPTNVSDLTNDLGFALATNINPTLAGKLSMSNSAGSAWLVWMLPNILSGKGSIAFGEDCTVSEYYSSAVGDRVQATGSYAHAEGLRTKATGHRSHAEGADGTASGSSSHVEGDNGVASGTASHAEGWGCTASGGSSHAGGNHSVASAESSFAHGYEAIASGWGSFALGYHCESKKNYTTSFGYRSKADKDYVFIWNGDSGVGTSGFYSDHGVGSFNINPKYGIEGFYIGNKNLKTIISEESGGGGGGGGDIDEGRVGQIATNVVRECSLGGIWDSALQVWWTPKMVNGSLTYQATTNVNLNAGN